MFNALTCLIWLAFAYILVGKLGERMSPSERAAVKARYKGSTRADVNEFMQRLPRDLLFVLRCNSIVRSVNKELGGTSRQRFLANGRAAVRGLELDGGQASVLVQAFELDTTRSTGALTAALPGGMLCPDYFRCLRCIGRTRTRRRRIVRAGGSISRSRQSSPGGTSPAAGAPSSGSGCG